MTKITLTYYDRLYSDVQGVKLPVRDGYKGGEVLTAAGAAAAAPAGARMVRLATDTAMTCDPYVAATSNVLLPAGAVDDFPCVEGQIITFTAA